MRGTDTWSTVLDWFVCDGEFAQIVANHLRLYFNLVESFTIVHTNNGANHLGNDDHVTEMGLDGLGLLHWSGFLLGLLQFGQKSHWLSLHATGQLSTRTSREQFHQILGALVEELLEVDASVRKLSEGTLLGLLSFFFGHVCWLVVRGT